MNNVTSNASELNKEDFQKLRDRTAQLFEIINMYDGETEEVKLCRNEIIELNIRLVPHVLKKYKPFGDDEFQLGCLGLIIASRTFDPKREVPFVNYACFCIERELHKAHRIKSNTFEFQAGNNLSSLDEMINLGNGDEVNKYEVVADDLSEEMFDKILEDFDLENLFGQIILPAIESIANRTKGQNATVDFETWRKLELRYLLEMAEIDSQKARVTLSAIASELGVSVQNIRMRHQRVIEIIKLKCIDAGIEI